MKTSSGNESQELTESVTSVAQTLSLNGMCVHGEKERANEILKMYAVWLAYGYWLCCPCVCVPQHWRLVTSLPPIKMPYKLFCHFSIFTIWCWFNGNENGSHTPSSSYETRSILSTVRSLHRLFTVCARHTGTGTHTIDTWASWKLAVNCLFLVVRSVPNTDTFSEWSKQKGKKLD